MSTHSYSQILPGFCLPSQENLIQQNIENPQQQEKLELEIEEEEQQQQPNNNQQEELTISAVQSEKSLSIPSQSSTIVDKKVTKKITKKSNFNTKNNNNKKSEKKLNTKKPFLRSYKKRLEQFRRSIKCSERTEKVKPQILQSRQNMFVSFQLINKEITQRKMWRKEIVSEIWEMAGGQMQKNLKKILQEKEEQLRSSLFLMNKQSANHFPQWNYLLVSQEKRSNFQKDLVESKVKSLEKYGKVIKQGYGNNPPSKIVTDIKKQFLMFEYEPGFQIKKTSMEKYESEDYEGAIKGFSKYLEDFNCSNKTALVNRGLSYMKINQPENALRDFNTCTQLYPQCHKGFLYAGQLQLQLQQYELALENFKQAQTLQSQDIDVIIYLAMTYFKLNQYEESKQACQKALKVVPTNAFAFAIMHKINQQCQQQQ